MTPQPPPVEVIIVGAGPIGLELAVALKRAGLDCLHFDAGQIGQTITWFPRQTRFFSSPDRIAIAGVPLQTADQAKASREEYLAYLRAVVQQFDLGVHTYERVTAIESRRPTGFTITTQGRHGQRQWRSRHVVLALGDMHRPHQLGIPGESLPHVSHYFDEPHPYFRQRLLIVGGKNSAVEAALRCHRAGARVAISYRADHFDEKAVKYWLLPEIQMLIRTKQIDFYPRTAPTRITADTVTLQCLDGGAARDVPADFVLLLTGYEMDGSLFELAGVRLVGENHAPEHDPATMQTNVPGVFVAGTAAAGTQLRFRLFIENCHEHVAKIVHAIASIDVPVPCPAAAPASNLPET